MTSCQMSGCRVGRPRTCFILYPMLNSRFCRRLRDFADRRLTTLEPAPTYGDLAPLLERQVKVAVIREHWGGQTASAD